MFTTKHHSLQALMGLGLFLFTIIITIIAVIYSYRHAGEVDNHWGGVLFWNMLLNIIGIVYGVMSINERDSFKIESYIAIGGNVLLILGWIVLNILGR